MLLSDHRKARGLTLAQAATELGLSDKSVGWLSEIENGKRDASLRLALKIERWSGGAVTAASVNSELRAVDGEPGSAGLEHGGGPCAVDASVVAPAEALGAGAKIGALQ